MMPKYDYLPGSDYRMIQPENMYHFSSDVQLLGQFMQIHKNDSVLDIGCGSGALMMYASLGRPAQLCGIDLFPEVIEAAEKNMEINGLKAEFLLGRVQDLKNRQFSVLVCNPPYFATENSRLINENAFIAAARHEVYLSTEELFQAVKRILKSNGRFYMVQRPENLNRILANAYRNSLGLTRSQYIYDKETSQCRAVLLEFRFSIKRETVVETPIFI